MNARPSFVVVSFLEVIASQRVRPEVAGPMTIPAKQSRLGCGLDCFVATLLAMTKAKGPDCSRAFAFRCFEMDLEIHPAAGWHCRHVIFLLWQFGHHRFGGDEQTGDR